MTRNDTFQIRRKIFEDADCWELVEEFSMYEFERGDAARYLKRFREEYPDHTYTLFRVTVTLTEVKV